VNTEIRLALFVFVWLAGYAVLVGDALSYR
jgi:hypothetical protein